MHAPRILDVGQCQIDGPRMGRFLKETLQAQVDKADTGDEALRLVEKHAYDLVLVNRILNRDNSPGLSVIATLLAAKPGLRAMLVSDYDDAQADAVKLGALRGFGKSAMDDPATLELLEKTLKGTTNK